MNNKFLKATLAGCILSISSFSNAGLLDLNEIVNSQNSSGVIVSDGLADAFDGFGRITDLNGLSLFSQVDTLESDHTYRFYEQFTNNTTSQISTTISFGGNLGSDGGENIVRSDSFSHITFEDFNNDGIPDTNPTPNTSCCNNDPVLAFVFGNNLWTSSNISVNQNRDDLYFNIDLTIDAGESVSLLFFSTLKLDNDNRASDIQSAISSADNYISNPNYTGLTSSQQDRIANFSVTSVPEPSTFAIFALGMIGLVLRKFKN